MSHPRAREEQDEEGEKCLVVPAAILSAVVEIKQRRRDEEQRSGNDAVGKSVQQIEPRSHGATTSRSD